MGRVGDNLYLAPHPALGGLVAHYTLSFAARRQSPAPGGAPPLALLPDASGCVVFTLQGGAGQAELWGPTSRLVLVSRDDPPGLKRAFIEFCPGGLRALTGQDPGELCDRRLPFEAPAQLFASMAGLEKTPGAPLAVAALLDAALLRRLPDDNALLGGLLARLHRAGGCLPVAALAAEAAVSPKRLNGLFAVHLGMGAKQYSRILRVNRAARLLPALPAGGLAGLAQDLGYYDQSHFIHDFKRVTGVPPARYAALSRDYYAEPYKLL